MPHKENRIIHRIAIAFGGKSTYPLPIGFYEKGFVNVFDENSTEIILKELDTIIDFTNYLTAKQKFFRDNKAFFSYEVDFLAFYLQTGLEFEVNKDVILLGDTTWAEHTDSEEYKQWKIDIEVSYVWDMMIQSFYDTIMKNNMLIEKRDEIEKALRIINLESRMNRMELGLLMEDTVKTKLKARMMKGFENADYAYVFMPLNPENYEIREAELTLRCDIARAELIDISRIQV